MTQDRSKTINQRRAELGLPPFTSEIGDLPIHFERLLEIDFCTGWREYENGSFVKHVTDEDIVQRARLIESVTKQVTPVVPMNRPSRSWRVGYALGVMLCYLTLAGLVYLVGWLGGH